MFHVERIQLISQDIAQQFSSEIYSTKNRVKARIGYHVFYYKIKTWTRSAQTRIVCLLVFDEKVFGETDEFLVAMTAVVTILRLASSCVCEYSLDICFLDIDGGSRN